MVNKKSTYKKLYLGIELGSTRIKSLLINEAAEVVCKGVYEWENMLSDGLWTYSVSDIKIGVQSSYRLLADNFKKITGDTLTEISAIGVSAMMHGYLAFDEDYELLVPFRTWRNTNTEAAAQELSKLLEFNIPIRWSVSHYYQAVLKGEPHIKSVKHLNTLAGYVHYLLTGKSVLGIGDASGMFPVKGVNYDRDMLDKFNKLLKSKKVDTPFESLLPTVLLAGEAAGELTIEGARFLDPQGELKPGCRLCPPEGDAGTGMVATNSVSPHTANVSAGTSAFLMAVLDKIPTNYHREIDLVCTPSARPVAMIHVNSFGSEITAWVNLFSEVIEKCGINANRSVLFDAIYREFDRNEENCEEFLSYNLAAGEPLLGLDSGVSLMIRGAESKLSLANFMKTLIYSSLAPLAIGCGVLKKENVKIDRVYGHGGFFNTYGVGQRAMSSAIGAPVTVLQNAGEGGAFGIALLSKFMDSNAVSLDEFLSNVFETIPKSTLMASEKETAEFETFLNRYIGALPVEKLATEVLQCWKI
ncbi:MAG: ATPase [Clostridia bacterium]|nr:ATPase [Clostridia bacterium]